MANSGTKRVHDLGGREGYGRVEIDDIPVGFAERWHAVVFSAMRAGYPAGAVRNSDHFRHSVERIDPDRYLGDTYYGRWLGGIESLYVEAGVLSAQELLDRCSIASAGLRTDPAIVGSDWHSVDHGTAARESTSDAIFEVGSTVRTRRPDLDGESAQSAGEVWLGHTRLPEYALGCVGEVVARHGSWVYPDTNAHGLGEQPQWLYSVCFTGAALYGSSAEPNVEVVLDLFEPYLQSVDEETSDE